MLVALARRELVPVHALNYKDKPEDAAAWLDRQGDPYTRTGVDVDGRVGIDWGVYGVPETFVIVPQGRISMGWPTADMRPPFTVRQAARIGSGFEPAPASV